MVGGTDWAVMGGEGFSKTLSVKYNVSCHPEGCFFPVRMIDCTLCKRERNGLKDLARGELSATLG